MPQSIAVFGAGPGLGHAVAHRYAQDGYDIVLVARRQEPLERLAHELRELTDAGVTAHVITADLADTDAIPALADQIRAKVGLLDALYYAPTPEDGFVAAANLTPQRAQAFMPLVFYSMVALVREFLPDMLARGEGAILTAQGASTVHGLPNMSGPGPAQAAQRNYLQSLHTEVAGQGVYVGMLYIGAIIEDSAFHAWLQQAKASGAETRDWGPTVTPAHLADILRDMHKAKAPAEVIYPDSKLPAGAEQVPGPAPDIENAPWRQHHAQGKLRRAVEPRLALQPRESVRFSCPACMIGGLLGSTRRKF